ncbi:aminopeptidase N-like [Chrysoperla carnea]|uniref:aminopeptidase N-like n=1 Tax=Chrysoperla carnea TaxID=189513 RepID=UPI001D097ABC|nr:aminopeptidase N-like [Chrysoperla carnea]
MDDEGLFDDVSTKIATSTVQKSIFCQTQNKLTQEPKIDDKFITQQSQQPIFAQPTTQPILPLYRPIQPPIEESSGDKETGLTEKMVDAAVVDVFSSVVPSSNQSSSDKLNKRAALGTKILHAPLSLFHQKTRKDNPNKNVRQTNQLQQTNLTGQYNISTSPISTIQDNKIDNRFRQAAGANNQTRSMRTVTLSTQDYFWVRKSTGILILILLLLTAACIGFLVYYFSMCEEPRNKCKTNKTLDLFEHDKSLSDYLLAAESHEIRNNTNIQYLNSLIFPTQYFVYLIIDPARFEYEVKVNVIMYINVITNEIHIHGANYLNPEIIFVGPDNDLYNLKSTSFDPSTELLNLTLNRSTTVGEYNLTLRYNGTIKTEIGGLFRISYRAEDNTTKWITMASFKPNFAHTLFPCFDEPFYKASFTVHLGYGGNNTFSLSNMGKSPVRKGDVENFPQYEDYYWDEYIATPLSPTMSIGFVLVPDVEDFQFEKKPGSYIQIICRKKMVDLMVFASETIDDIMRYYELYFNGIYALDKLDVFAVPNLVKEGVGSWGLIMLTESQVTYNNKDAGKLLFPIEQEKDVILNLAQKLIEQWFGFDVTMTSWSENWLYEGFAIFMKYKTLKRLRPTWNAFGYFIVETMQPILFMESLIPHTKVLNDTDIYLPSPQKGAVMLRMIEQMISPKVFDLGIMNLMREKKLQTASFRDICNFLTLTARTENALSDDMEICDVLSDYVTKRGYPILKMDRNYVTNEAILTQDQFKLSTSMEELYPKSETDDLTGHGEEGGGKYWTIPISIVKRGCASTESQPKSWMPKQKTHKLGFIPANDWVLLNLQGSGFYRVNYDQRNWRLIGEQLFKDYNEIDEINRAKIIDDLFNLARASKVSYSLALDTVSYLRLETEYVPWLTAFNNLVYIDMMLITTPEYDYFKDFVLILISQIYEQVGLQGAANEPPYITKLRNLIVKWACYLNDKKCTDYSTKIFKRYMGSNTGEMTINVETKFIVYCTAVRLGTYTEWNFLWKQYLSTDNQFEKEVILRALACSRDPWIINLYLWRIISPIDDDFIQPYLYTLVVEQLSLNPVAAKATLDLVMKNYKMFGKQSRQNKILMDMMKSVSLYVHNPRDIKQIKQWMRNISMEMTHVDRDLIDHLFAGMDNNVFFMDAFRWQVVTWLRSYITTMKQDVSLKKNRMLKHPAVITTRKSEIEDTTRKSEIEDTTRKSEIEDKTLKKDNISIDNITTSTDKIFDPINPYLREE